MTFGQDGFKSLVKKRPRYLSHIVKRYKNVIYTDVDTVWLKDPRPFLKNDYDFWAQLDGVISGHPYQK